MTISELKNTFIHSLDAYYPTEEIQSFFVLLAEKHLRYTRLDMAINPNETLSDADCSKFQSALKRLENQEPIQYILGETEFFSLPFQVSPATLIPRPETESLVQWVIAEDSKRGDISKILDIGTGSGCIAIALAYHLPKAVVHAIDFSKEAIAMAKRNAKDNNVAVQFSEVDILQTTSLGDRFSCIVSNPPYVRESEKTDMAANVLEHEPSTALFVSDDDPLVFYRKIARLAKEHLIPGGSLFFEINEYLGEEMIDLLTSEGYKNIHLKKDMFGKDRMIRGSFQ